MLGWRWGVSGDATVMSKGGQLDLGFGGRYHVRPQSAEVMGGGLSKGSSGILFGSHM